MSQFDETFDWVVVGTGGAALCSGLYMASQGKRVLLLEKTDRVGGSTARSGGVMWVPNNPLLKQAGIDDSHEKATTYLEGLAAEYGDTPASTPERRQTYLRESLNMLSFLQQQGIPLERAAPWPDYYDERPGGLQEGRCVVAKMFDLKELGEWREKIRDGFLPMPVRLMEALDVGLTKVSWKARRTFLTIALRIVGSRLLGKRVTSAGAALQGRQLQALLRHGAEVRLQSPVKELITENDTVVGIVTEKAGQPWRVKAELGVLVAAGGFARNQRMRDHYQPNTSIEWSSTSPGDTGEMIEEMLRHGAALSQMSEMVGNQCIMPPDSQYEDIKQPAQSVTAKPHAILVDQTGERYMNEGGSYMAYCKGMLARHQSAPAVPSWAILDSQYMQKYMLAGASPGKKKQQQWQQQGFLKIGDSLTELAKAIEVDPTTLTATVERFNGFVDNNCDEDFHRGERAYDCWLGDPTHKPSATLGRIDKAPFYAVKVYPGDVSTFGGVVTDVNARVLREDGSVIKGLYAAGVSSASVMGYVYPGAGSSVGPALTFGYVAAKHALL